MLVELIEIEGIVNSDFMVEHEDIKPESVEVNCVECDYYYSVSSGSEFCCSPEDPDTKSGVIPRGDKLCTYNRKHGCGKEGRWFKKMEIEIDSAKIFQEVLEDINKDPKTKRLAEEYQRLYGTLTSDDLKMQFTI